MSAFELVCVAKRLSADRSSDFISVAHQLIEKQAASENGELPEAIAKAIESLPKDNNTDAFPAFFELCAKELDVKPKAEGSTMAALLKASRSSAKPNTFIDPSTQKFWFQSFGATAQDVSLQLFLQKFISHFEEVGDAEKTQKCRDDIGMTNSVWKPLRQMLVGNCERLSKTALQDFLDASDEYSLPDAIFNTVGTLASGIPPLCPDIKAIIDAAGTNLEQPDQVAKTLRDSGCVFLDSSKLATARLEQYFTRVGLSKNDGKEMALGVYMRHRQSLSNKVVHRSKVDQALYDLKDKCVKIDLSHCHLKDLSAVKEALTSSFDGVEELDLSGNNLHAAGVADVVEILKKQPNLKTLSLRGNNCQLSGVKKIIDALHQHALSNLDIGVCHIGPAGADYIAENIACTKIRHLGCSGNDFGPEGAKSLAAVLSGPHRLCTLSMGSNHIRNEGAQAIADSLGDNKFLVNLGLADNDIQDEGVAAIATAVKGHKSIANIDFSFNWCTEAGLEKLTAGIANHPGLSVSCRGFSEEQLAEVMKVGQSNNQKEQQRVKDLSHRPLAMWSSDDVMTWTHLKLGRLDLGLQMKRAGIDGGRLRTYTMKDLAKDGFTDPDLQRTLFNFQDTITPV